VLLGWAQAVELLLCKLVKMKIVTVMEIVIAITMNVTVRRKNNDFI